MASLPTESSNKQLLWRRQPQNRTIGVPFASKNSPLKRLQTMYRKILLVALFSSMIPLASCNKEEQIETSEKETSLTIATPESKARTEAYNLLRSIYKNAYDGEIIDFNKFEAISIASGYMPQDKLRSISQPVGDLSVEDVLSPQMMNIYHQMVSFISSDRHLSPEEREQLLVMSSTLGAEDRSIMENIIWSTDLTLSALDRLNSELGQDGLRKSAKEWATTVGKYACNLASGGIGTVWGSMGGAIASLAGASAVLSGGVSIVVGLAVGAAIGTVAC